MTGVERKAKFQEAIIYLLSGKNLYIDGEYIASAKGKDYQVSKVIYKRKWYKTTLGEWTMDFQADVKTCKMGVKMFYYFLYTAEYFSTVKPFRFKGGAEQPAEANLTGLLYWLKGHALCSLMDDHEALTAYNNWIHHSDYSDIDSAIADIEEHLFGNNLFYNAAKMS
jgi:hypothetical protein